MLPAADCSFTASQPHYARSRLHPQIFSALAQNFAAPFYSGGFFSDRVSFHSGGTFSRNQLQSQIGLHNFKGR